MKILNTVWAPSPTPVPVESFTNTTFVLWAVRGQVSGGWPQRAGQAELGHLQVRLEVRQHRQRRRRQQRQRRQQRRQRRQQVLVRTSAQHERGTATDHPQCLRH